MNKWKLISNPTFRGMVFNKAQENLNFIFNRQHQRLRSGHNVEYSTRNIKIMEAYRRFDGSCYTWKWKLTNMDVSLIAKTESNTLPPTMTTYDTKKKPHYYLNWMPLKYLCIIYWFILSFVRSFIHSFIHSLCFIPRLYMYRFLIRNSSRSSLTMLNDKKLRAVSYKCPQKDFY